MASRLRKLLRFSMAVSLVVSQVLLLTGTEASAGVILTVTSSGDGPDAVPGDGVCDTGVTTSATSPDCTLRAAIQEANEPGPVRNIVFSIADASAMPIIQPKSPLPPITRQVEIDATTQPGFAGMPNVIIDGSKSASGNGLDVDANDSVIRGLVIYGFDGPGIAVWGDRNTIAGNFIGVDARGTDGRGNGQGVVVHGRRNIIGGSSHEDRNVISGNEGTGISVDGAERTEVLGNYLGLDASGVKTVPNNGSGVEVVGVSDRTTVGPGNVIGGNSSNGVHVAAGTTRTHIAGNRVGTNAEGSLPVGNGLNGIDVEADQVLVSDNQISGNMSNGIQIGHGSAVVHGNFVGTAAESTKELPNGGDGIHIKEGASESEIGGTGPGEGNVIAFNHGAGVALRGNQGPVAFIVSNSIFGNGEVGIDLGEPGPTTNDPGDTDDGPNDILNYPTITGAVATDGQVDVDFELDAPVGSYRVEFFLNPSGADPSGFGEGETPVSFLTVRRTSETGEFKHTIAAAEGDILTATASRCTNPSCSGLLFTSELSEAVTVSTGNQAPTLDQIPIRTIEEETPLSFTVAASDPDRGDTLIYGLMDEPAGASIDPSTGVFNWTPMEAHGPGIYTFAVSVSDDGVPRLSDTQMITIIVAEINEAPRVVSPGDQANEPGETVDLAIVVNDQDLPANTISFEATGLPPGLAIDPNTGRISGTIRATESSSSPHTVTVTATDDGEPGLSDQVVFIWDTSHTNRPPSLGEIGDKTVAEHSTLRFSATASDEDGDTLTFDLLNGPPGASIDSNTGVFAWTPNEFQGPGTYTFSVTVNDNGTPSLTDVLTITVTVTELNQAPIAIEDEASTAEDTPVIVDVLANDLDLDAPANTLRIGSVSQPAQGTVTIVGNQIMYAPKPDFNGQDRFDYTVGDGLDEATESVLISVRAVNDSPIAIFDRFHLNSFRQGTLDVLANDLEPDHDPLTVEIVSTPEIGMAWVEDNEIVYRPQNGWTGTTRFNYAVNDPSGESSGATVEIVVGQQVLVTAQNLANRLGVEVLLFRASSPSDEKGSFNIVGLDAITLLAKSFLHTAASLKVPLGLLGLAVAATSGFGRSSELPAIVYGRRRRHWAAVRLSRQERLSAYSAPGGDRRVYTYEPTATGIVSTGKSRRAGGAKWLQVQTPKGAAWIEERHLTEQRDFEAFSDDERPVRLLHDLAQRLRRSDSLSRVVGSGGLLIALSRSLYHLTPEVIDDITSGPRHRERSGSDQLPMPPGKFSAAVAKPLLEAYEALPRVTAPAPGSSSRHIPTELQNLHYLTLEGEGVVQPWLVFFEYRKGKATIAALATTPETTGLH